MNNLIKYFLLELVEFIVFVLLIMPAFFLAKLKSPYDILSIALWFILLIVFARPRLKLKSNEHYELLTKGERSIEFWMFLAIIVGLLTVTLIGKNYYLAGIVFLGGGIVVYKMWRKANEM